jgi:hypothetical protein
MWLHKWIKQLLRLERNCGIMQLIMIMLMLNRARLLFILMDISVLLFVSVTFVICFSCLMSGLCLIFCHYMLCGGLGCRRHVLKLRLKSCLPQKEYSGDG